MNDETPSGVYDLRRQPRMATQIGVRYQTENGERFEYATDISSGGLYVESEAPPARGTILDVHLDAFGAEGEAMDVSAEVVHIEEDEDGQPRGMGLRFVDQGEEVAQRLAAFIKKARARDAGGEEGGPNEDWREGEDGVAGVAGTELNSGFAYLSPELIPMATEDVDLLRQPLTTNEGYIMSLVDGVSNVNLIRQICNLDLAQMSEALIDLAIKGVIRFLQPAPAASPLEEELDGAVPAPETGDDAEAAGSEANSREAERFFERGIQEYEQERFDRAMIYFNLAASFRPDDERYRDMYRKCQIARETGQAPPVDDAAPGAATPDPEQPAPLPQTRSTPEAISRARGFYDEARRAEAQGAPEDAVGLLHRAIETAPDVGEFYNRLALVYFKFLRNYRKAEEYSRRAVQVAPENAVFAKNFARIRQLVSGEGTQSSGGPRPGRSVWTLPRKGGD